MEQVTTLKTRKINGGVVSALLALVGASQREMARWLGVSESTASRRLAGLKAWSADDIGHLADHLDVPTDIFYLETAEAVARLVRPLNPNDGGWAPRGSNPRPMDYECEVVHLESVRAA